jgi:hypothetical protein
MYRSPYEQHVETRVTYAWILRRRAFYTAVYKSGFTCFRGHPVLASGAGPSTPQCTNLVLPCFKGSW